MEALKLFEPYWEQLKRLAIYAQYCAENDISNLVCRDFWTWSMVAAFGIAVLIFVLIAKTVFKEQLEFYRNKKRLEARKIVADPDTMDQHKWVGDSNTDVNLSQEELAAALRAGIQQKKASS